MNNRKKPLPDRPYKNNKIVRMFSSSITSDTISTISTLLFLLKSDVNSKIYLNRIGRNPVEHFIVSFRMLSKNQNTFHKLKKIVGEKNLLDSIERTIKMHQRITGRIPSLGEDIKNSENNNFFDFEPKILAYSLFHYFGFQIEKNSIEKLKILPQSIIESEKNSNDFFESLAKVIANEDFKFPQKKLLSTTQFDSVETVKIQDRLSGKGNFF